MLNNRKLMILLTALLVLSLAVVGCGGGSSDPAPAPTPDPAPSGDVPAVDAPAEVDKSDWPRSLQLGAASIGGAYYVYAGGMANVLEEVVGITTGVEVTGGPVHNIQMVEDGALDLGLTTMGPAWEGWNGEGEWTGGEKHQNMRAMFPMYNTYSQWWAGANSGIASIADLDGKRVGSGPQGGTAGVYHPQFAEMAGVSPNFVFAGLSDLVGNHLDRQLDANTFSSGIPVAGVLETSSQMDLVMFGVDGELRDKVIAEFPFWTPAQIPVSAYPDFLTEPVETVAIGNWAIAHKDLPDSLVYEIVKAIMENNEMMIQSHQAAAETLPQFASDNNWFPMHPGAIKYFEEIGIDLAPAVK